MMMPDLLLNIKELSSEKPPYFHNEKLENFNEVILGYYIKEITTEENASIDINKIEGTNHPDYHDKTWGYVLENAKRMKGKIRELRENPQGFIFDATNRYNWSIAELNGKFYILDVNHSTVIFRYLIFYNKSLPKNINGATKHIYKIDTYLHNKEQIFNKLITKKNFKNLLLNISQAFPGDTPHILLENSYTKSIHNIAYEDLDPLINSLEETSLFKRLAGNRFNKFFRKSFIEAILA